MDVICNYKTAMGNLRNQVNRIETIPGSFVNTIFIPANTRLRLGVCKQLILIMERERMGRRKREAVRVMRWEKERETEKGEMVFLIMREGEEEEDAEKVHVFSFFLIKLFLEMLGGDGLQVFPILPPI